MTKLIDITGKALSGEWGNEDESGNGIPVLRTTNFTNEGVVNFDNVITRVITKKNIQEKFLKNGDIILEKSGGSDKQPVGRVVYFEGPNDTYLFNNFTGLLRVKDQTKWLPKFVFYSLYSNYRKGGTIPFENKTTGLHNLKTDDYVARYEVLDLPYLEQQIIVETLDKTRAIIDARNQELQTLDELIKARFVEMFGNPFASPKWNIEKMKDCTITISDGSTINKDYYQENGDVLFLRIQNVWFNEFRLDDSVYISNETNEMYGETSLRHGDLLITKIGRYYTQDSSLGRVSLYLGEDNKANYSNNIMRIRFSNKLVSEYVNVLLNLDDYNKYIRSVSKGGTDKRALSKTIIGEFPIIVPPIELQNEFAEFVKEVDKSKVVVQKALDEAQTLFDSLMQQYFG